MSLAELSRVDARFKTTTSRLFSVVLAAAAFTLPFTAAPPAKAAGSTTVKLETGLDHDVLSAEGGKVYLRLSLKALRRRHTIARTPVNLALVLDRSGSMSGPRILAAKEAARLAIARLSSDDVVSLVAYDHNVSVLQRAAYVRDTEDLSRRINDLRPGGRTALYAGVEAGGREVARHLSDRRVNRVILLSDGLANVGPSSPHALSKLGQELAGRGMSVTTIGLGLRYNEDLMQQLASASDGNHAFAEHPRDLAEIFDAEFGDALSIAAQDIEIIIECAPGYTPRRILGRKGTIENRRVKLDMKSLQNNNERYVVVELDAAATAPRSAVDVADVTVSYRDLDTATRRKLDRQITASVSSDKAKIRKSINKRVISDVTEQRATLANEQAVKLRDAGKVVEARKVLKDNAAYVTGVLGALVEAPGAAPSPQIVEKLKKLEKSNTVASENLDERSWAKTRKSMRYDQHRSKTQQTY